MQPVNGRMGIPGIWGIRGMPGITATDDGPLRFTRQRVLEELQTRSFGIHHTGRSSRPRIHKLVPRQN
jgi:hypothetical protein